ncbi:MAG TPA: ribosome biogenesis factor YjgA [Casimicrobiaceae bacterium]|jgi:ribosome-associated protein
MTPAYRRPPGRNDLPTGSGPEDDRPSKTQLKREMDALQDLGETLVGLDASRLAELDLPERLVDAISLARGITRHEARRRQMQYVGKLMRHVDAAPIRATLERWDTVPQAEKARFASIERWRARLLDDAQAIDAFVAAHPSADRDALARAIVAALAERAGGGAPRAFRELFRLLRHAVGDAPPD